MKPQHEQELRSKRKFINSELFAANLIKPSNAGSPEISMDVLLSAQFSRTSPKWDI